MNAQIEKGNRLRIKSFLKNFLNYPQRLLFLACLFFSVSSFAQTSVVVKGIISDVSNESIIGASIMEKGNAQNGVISDLNGNYTLTVPTDATIIVSYLGMDSQEIKVNARTSINIVLAEATTALNEVVVTALGIKREAKALGYAITEIKSDALTAGREDNVMAALSGKVAGIDISGTSAGPSGSTRVLIRGNSQLTGTNLPLYVIDGVTMDNTQLGEVSGKWGEGYDFGDGLSSLNPDDIESVSILKGASASALYGARASNGVILITTKSGKNKKGLGIEFSSNVSVVKLLSGFDDYQRVYGQGRNGMPPMTIADSQGTSALAWGAKLDPNYDIMIYNGQYKPYANIDNNILSFFRTGSTVTNALALNGGDDKSNFRISISDMRNNDIVPNSDMSRTTIMMRGSAKLSPKLSMEGRANYSLEKVNNRPALADSPNNIGLSVIGLAPNFNQAWLGQDYKDEYGRYTDWNGGNIYRINPYWSINEMSNLSYKNRLMGLVQLEYELTPHLSLQGKASTDTYEFKTTIYTPQYTPNYSTGQMSESLVNVFENNFEAMLRYKNRFGEKLDINAFIGGNIWTNNSKSFTNTGKGEVDPSLESILNYTNYELAHSYYRKQVNSIFGAVNFGYDDFAYLDFTLRNDISSSLHKDYRSYVYPSVSGSFIFSNYFKIPNKTLSFGKIRASWAKVGGDTDPYGLNLNYSLYPYTLNGLPLGQIGSSNIPNIFLKPTSNYSYEVGLDLRTWNNRVKLDFTYYYLSSKDQIMSLPTSSATGYFSAKINAGEITNQGIETALTIVPVQTKDFEWSTTVNMAKNINKVVSLHEDIADYEISSARWANAFIYASEGQAYGNIVGRAFNRDPNGNIIFQGGLPTYTESVQVLGNGTYDFTLGWGHSFFYKGITLGVLFDMKWGADIYSMSSSMAHMNGTAKATLEGREGWYNSEEQRWASNAEIKDWTPTGGYLGKGVKEVVDAAGNITYVENDVYVNPFDYWSSLLDNTAEPFIYDASFIKLRELNISYALPARTIKNSPFQSVSFSFFGRNLLTLYDSVKNIDPESNYNSSNGQGFEYGSLPSRRTFGFGINVKF